MFSLLEKREDLGGQKQRTMPYLNFDLDYFTHRKTIRLVGLLGTGAESIPPKLWVYCGKYHPEDGAFKGYTDAEIEAIADFKQSSEKSAKSCKIIDALVSVGFLDDVDGIYVVHDWIEHAGHLAAFKKRAKLGAKERWRRYAISIAKKKNSIARRQKNDARLGRYGRYINLNLNTEEDSTKLGNKRDTDDDGFEQFWQQYRRKVGKEKARAAWRKIKPNAELRVKIIETIQAWAKSEDWQKENGRFIPHPTTWLNRGGWDDELPTGETEDERLSRLKREMEEEKHGMAPRIVGIPRSGAK